MDCAMLMEFTAAGRGSSSSTRARSVCDRRRIEPARPLRHAAMRFAVLVELDGSVAAVLQHQHRRIVVKISNRRSALVAGSLADQTLYRLAGKALGPIFPSVMTFLRSLCGSLPIMVLQCGNVVYRHERP